MPATYVEITREDFEQWLRTLGKPWSRDERTAGVYYVHLSDRVGVKISSSIGSRDSAMGRASASVDITLASLVTRKTLNRKGGEQSRYHRTQKWRDNFKRGVQHFAQVYEAARDFYERIAPIEDREKYKTERLRVLARIPDVSDDDVLSHVNKRLVQGGVLDDAQEAVMRVAANLSEDQIKFLARLERLRQQSARDARTLGLIVNVRRTIWAGKPLSAEVRQQLAAALKQYGV